MKKELLIVILVVVGIIGISILLKYVIFAGYSKSGNAESKNICNELCRKERFSTSGCRLDNCLKEERVITSNEENLKRIDEFCDSEFGAEPTLPGAWVCCCR